MKALPRSIEGLIDKNNPTGAGGGFFPQPNGLVKQGVQRPRRLEGQASKPRVHGVYRNATVYLNGRRLSKRPQTI